MAIENLGDGVKDQIHKQATFFVRAYAEALDEADSSPNKLSDGARGHLESWGHGFRTLRIAAGLSFEDITRATGMEEAGVFMFESGLTGGEKLSLGQLNKWVSLARTRLRSQMPAIMGGVDDSLEQFMAQTGDPLAKVSVGQLASVMSSLEGIAVIGRINSTPEMEIVKTDSGQ